MYHILLLTVLKEEKILSQRKDLIGQTQISPVEVGIRNSKIGQHQKGQLVTFNLTTGIETSPNPGKEPSVRPCWNCLTPDASHIHLGLRDYGTSHWD